MVPILLLWLLLMTTQGASAATENFYIGADACASCHQVEFDNWSKSPHFAAFKTLEKKGEEEDATCYVCHTTGFGEKGGFLSPGVTPELEGVQCESCHGPGGKHVRERQKYSIPGLSRCASCHTPDIDPDFDPQKAWEKIHH